MRNLQEYKAIVEDIIRYINENVEKDGLQSLTIVGSFADPNHKMEYLNDLDIFYIYDDAVEEGKRVRIRKDIHSSIVKLNDEIVELFSDDDIEVKPSYDCGPIKPVPNAKIQIELHNLIYTVNRWLREEPIILFDRARLYRLLYGKPPGDIYNAEKISKYSVIRDIFGIDDCINMIKSKVVKYYIWEIDPKNENIMKIVKKEKNLQQNTQENLSRYIELIFYSVIKSSINSVRVFRGEANFAREDCDYFLNFCKKFEKKDFLIKILQLKDRYRAGKLKLTEGLVLDLANNGVEYLYKLKDFLEKSEEAN